MRKVVEFFCKRKKFAYILVILGLLLYCILSIHYAITQRSTIDEGLYLYKGYQFALGKYSPYQDNGFRTLYSPLAYLVPGWIQSIFGPGLLTGRVTALAFGALALIGFWLLTRRLAGDWWAAAAVWAAALNPGTIRTYSFGVVQPMVICLLVWTLYFCLQKERHLWQIILGSVFAGLLLLTRQDMAPVLPLLLLYIFWEYGGKYGGLAVLAGFVTVVAGHAPFWPEILKAWVDWIPAQWTPFLNAWRSPTNAVPQLSTPPTVDARVSGLLEGLRFHFISLTGFISSLVFWPKREAWKTSSRFKTAAFLAVLYAVLLGLHLWAGLGFSVGNGFNASTFSTYLSFFDYLGILVFIVVFQAAQKRVNEIRQFAAALIILAFSFGIGYGGFDVFGDALVGIKIPRLKTMITSGHLDLAGIPLWDFLSGKYGLSLLKSKLLISGFTGLFVGVAFLLAAIVLYNWFRKKRLAPYSYGFVAMVSFLLVGAILVPTPVLGGGFTQWDCGENVINTFETVGHSLARVIPAESRIYWDGGNAVALLLYTPDLLVYPQQVDGIWNFYQGGDVKTLARLGDWNDELAVQWRDQADVILFQQADYPAWQSFVSKPGLEETVGFPKAPLNCEPDTYLRLFLQKK